MFVRFRHFACRTAAILACAFCLIAADSTASEMFSWTDERGNLHFTSDRNQIPARYRNQAQRTRPKANISVVEDGDTASARERLETLKQRDRELEQQRRHAETQQQRSKQRVRTPGPEPQKYAYDCFHRTKNGRCGRRRTAAWDEWDKLRQEYEAAQ